MSEGLRVNVIPMLDENEFDKLIKSANEKLSNTTFDFSSSFPISPTVAPSGESVTATSTSMNGQKVDATGSEITISDKSAETVAKKESDERTKDEERPNSPKSIMDRIRENISDFMSKYESERSEGVGFKDSVKNAVMDKLPSGLSKVTGVMAVGFDIVSQIFDRLLQSSKVLQEVWGLFNNTFGMILTPIGNIIAIEMMPMIRKMYEIIGDWMSSAMDIYDMEGWQGLIDKAFEVAVKLMWEAIQGIGSIIWDAIVQSITSSPTWMSIQLGMTNLVAGFKWITGTMPTILGNLFEKWFSDIRNGIINIWSTITSIGEKIGAGVSGVWNSFVSGVQDIVPFFATGGIVSQPTPAVFGEAGTEAVMPLDYLDSFLLNKEQSAIEMATPYIATTITEILHSNGGGISSTEYNSRSATTVYNTINVYSDNPDRVGNEVKRLLDKSVGKVLSLY